MYRLKSLCDMMSGFDQPSWKAKNVHGVWVHSSILPPCFRLALASKEVYLGCDCFDRLGYGDLFDRITKIFRIFGVGGQFLENIGSKRHMRFSI